MKISIKKNKDIQLKLPVFTVDRQLNKDMPEPLNSCMNNTGMFIVFVGVPKQGKTSLMMSFFNDKNILRKVFDEIYVVMPSYSRQSIKNNIFDKHLPVDNIYDDLNIFTALDITNKVKKNREENKISCIVLDDVTKDLRGVEHELKDLIFNRRHYKLCIFLTVQSLMGLTLTLRKMINCIFLKKPVKREFETIMHEFLEMNNKEALQLMKLYRNPYDFLIIDVTNKRIFINWDEVMIEDE